MSSLLRIDPGGKQMKKEHQFHQGSKAPGKDIQRSQGRPQTYCIRQWNLGKTLILAFLLKIKNLCDPVLSFTSYIRLSGLPKEIEAFSKPGFLSRVYVYSAHTGIAVLGHK